MQLATCPTCILVWHTSVHTSQRSPAPLLHFFCCSALWFYLPSIFTEQCVISAVLNGKMRSKWLNEYPRVAVKGKNQTHMNQSSGKKIMVSPVCPPFIFARNSQGRCLLKRFLTTSLVPTHSFFFCLSVGNINTPTMYFVLCQKLTTCSLTGVNGVLHKQTVIFTWFAF